MGNLGLKKVKVAVVAPCAGDYRFPNSDLLHPMLRKITSKSLYGGVSDGASMCPITKSIRNNTFEFVSPLDFRFKISDDGTICLHNNDNGINQDYYHRFRESIETSILFDKDNVQIIATDIMFTTDTPGTKVMFWPHPTSNHPKMMLGMIDIYDWLRVWHYTFFAFPDPNKEYIIKKGDPLAMVSILTPNMEPVELLFTEPTVEMEKLSRREATKLYKIKDWFKIFKIAGNLRPKKLIPDTAKSYFGTFKE